MTLRRPGAMGAAMQGRSVAFVAGGYGRGRGRRSAGFSAAGRHKASFRETFGYERSFMKLRPEEITSILKQRIEEYDVETDLAEVGTVLEIGDGIARVYGLENCVAGEMLDLGANVTGVALNLEEDNVGVALFGEWQQISEGDPVKRTGRVLSVPVGDELIGRIVDPL